MDIEDVIGRYRVTDGRKLSLAKYDPNDAGGLDLDKKQAQSLLQEEVKRLAALQDTLYAQNRWAVLLIFQAMDAAGKDSAIKHVMSGVNPQGVQVYSFKQPSPEELDHDFLWRTTRALPERGRIGVFNRSYYEEVLVVRVHEAILRGQRLPPELVGKRIWQERLEDITSFERYLARNGTLILKFFLNVSPEEQKKRFLARLDDPEKNWKFEAADVKERQHWPAYMEAYEAAIGATATPAAPWHIIPADRKWFTRLAVVATINAALRDLKLHYPKVEPEKMAEFEAARQLLDAK